MASIGPAVVTVKIDTREAQKLLRNVRREIAVKLRLAKRALRLIDTYAWSAVSTDNPKATKELQRRIDVCRNALKSLS